MLTYVLVCATVWGSSALTQPLFGLVDVAVTRLHRNQIGSVVVGGSVNLTVAGTSHSGLGTLHTSKGFPYTSIFIRYTAESDDVLSAVIHLLPPTADDDIDSENSAAPLLLINGSFALHRVGETDHGPSIIGVGRAADGLTSALLASHAPGHLAAQAFEGDYLYSVTLTRAAAIPQASKPWWQKVPPPIILFVLFMGFRIWMSQRQFGQRRNTRTAAAAPAARPHAD